MTETTLLLPTSSDAEEWTKEEMAILSAAGLWVPGKNDVPGHWAPRPTVAAFLAHCRRTGLDPIARQIYAIERAGRWGIQASIDGFRVVAQRSLQYAGQTPTEWTGDGKTWVDVWLSDTPPAAARVGVRRTTFVEPLYAVATWKSFAVYDTVWEDGPNGRRRKTNAKEPSAMWGKMPDHMIAKVAEAAGVAKAFPMDLSGLYIAEELDREFQDVGIQENDPAPLTVARRAVLPQDASGDDPGVVGPGESVPASDPATATPGGDLEPTDNCARCGDEKPVTELFTGEAQGLCDDCAAILAAEDEADRVADRQSSRKGSGRG